MKEEYTTPVLEIITFNTEDIIVTSGGDETIEGGEI